MEGVRIYRLSERAITISWESKIDRDIHALVLETDRRLCTKPFAGWIENVPAYHTLTVYYDPFIAGFDPSELLEEVATRHHESGRLEGRHLRIPVVYNGPDLAIAAEKLRINIENLISLHSSGVYHVYMLGFMPGFPYMGTLVDELVLPRKDVPAPKVPAGSVAIAGHQTGIYPFESPGGWYVIGHTSIPLFSAGKAYFEPGDEVEFYSITE
ncbi:MAG TPA: 5-oxoprolinase subunit PxpB [Chitinophagaceae bacterium]|nr:5-oxoprolinase subunit PxpB [Chitinophagaceae bacterium]